MTKANKKTIDSYLKSVISKLNCSAGLKSIFKRQLREDMFAFADGKENITEYMLRVEFGEPEDIADALYSREDYEALLKKSKIQSLILTVLIIIAAIILIFFGCCLFDAMRGALFDVMRISEPYIN